MQYIITILSLFAFVGCNHAESTKTKSATKNQITEETKEQQTENKKTMDTNKNYEVATLGGGCYWCMEAVFQRLDGVIKVESGFSGGHVKNPSYHAVCTGTTGHAEVIQITYDTTKVQFSEILKVFFTMHDPTTLNQQGNDIGTQYRSAIFYHSEAQKTEAEKIIADLNEAHAYPSKIVTEVTKFDVFYKAEDYHQNYYNDNKTQGYCQYVIQPKVEKFEKVFKDRLKK
ncbi:MAG: peptide-methionine (S)-S-oxide reductase MsrA [Chitinophagales bacterium]